MNAADRLHGRLPVLALLGAGLALLCLLFHEEIAAAAEVWSTSTAYGHCWLVVPIVGWLLWERRAAALAYPPAPVAWPALVAPVLAFAWLAADWLGIMEGRQLVALAFCELLLLAMLGEKLWWALSPALLYLVFLVPFGAFVTPALQQFTAAFVNGGLSVLGIPHTVDAFQIEIPEGRFYVAEACAGLRFLIASIAFGALYAVTMFRDGWRRVVYIAVACVVPVVANGVRALGIVTAGHVVGSAEAAAADHVIYGWLFFSVVILLLALAGLPFRQAPAPVPAGVGLMPDEQRGWRPPLIACLPMLAAAVAAPGFGLLLDNLPAGAASVTVQHLGGISAPVTVTTTLLPLRSNPARILAAARDPALSPLGADIDSGILDGPAHQWVLLTDRESGAVSAYEVVVDGVPMLGGLHDRLRMARDMLGRSRIRPVAIAVSAESRDALVAFLSGNARL
jgi:exosortase A